MMQMSWGRAVVAAATLGALIGMASGGTATAASNPYAASGDSVPTKLRKLIVFGDSWSDFARTKGRVETWNSRLRSRDHDEYAKSGATASSPNYFSALGRDNTLRSQVDAFLRARPKLAGNDLTVVYIGNDDVREIGNDDSGRSIDIDKAFAELKRQVDRLIAYGVNDNGRYLFIAQVHNLQDVPESRDLPAAQRSKVKAKAQRLNALIAGLANDRDNVIAVDLYTAMLAVTQNPGRYGVTNVTGFDRRKSETTWLYDDDHHFGDKAQELIKQVFNHYLTNGWIWASELSAGGPSSQRLKQDITAGKVFRPGV